MLGSIGGDVFAVAAKGYDKECCEHTKGAEGDCMTRKSAD